MIEIITIVSLLIFIAIREWQHIIYIKEKDKIYQKIDDRHQKHIETLEEKIVKTNPNIYWTEKHEGKRPAVNEMMTSTDNEVMLGDMPFMDLSKGYKIQTEEGSSTPLEETVINKK